MSLNSFGKHNDLYVYNQEMCLFPLHTAKSRRGHKFHMVLHQSSHWDNNLQNCRTVPFGSPLLRTCVFYSICEQDSDLNKTEAGSGCFGQDPSVSSLHPTEPPASTGPNRQSPVGHRLTMFVHQGPRRRDAECSN